MRSSSIVLLSGGLDSLAAFHWASLESDLMLGLTFDYGQRAARKEIESAEKICRHYDVKHRVIELGWYASLKRNPLTDASQPLPQMEARDLDNLSVTEQSAKAVWIPNRNGVFINIAASLAEDMMANWIVVGFNAEEAQTFPDNSQTFVAVTNESFSFSTHGRVKLMSPMGGRTKKEIVRWGMEKNLDFSSLWSCYLGGDKMCAACESCLRCQRAFREAGVSSWLEKLF